MLIMKDLKPISKCLLLSLLILFIDLIRGETTTSNIRENVHPTSSNKYDASGSSTQPVFGPQLQAQCKLNYEILDPRHIEATRNEILQCREPYINCTQAENSKFRTIDGTCNNLNNPTWGKSDSCTRRILPFDYADGVSQPRVSCTGKPLPNARVVTNVFHAETKLLPMDLTTHYLEWGQMVMHDLSLNDIFHYQAGSDDPFEAFPCCDPVPHFSDTCVSVPVPPDDPFYPKFGQTCISVPRTIPCTLCSTSKRLQWNQNTAYQDLSIVYGSNEEIATKLRSYEAGHLAVESNPVSGPLPPTVHAERLCISPKFEKGCYHTGENLANQNLLLLTAHTFLLRHHNFICDELSEINPLWDDERLYQEARRINIAIVQSITYGNYLPKALGEIMLDAGISLQPGANYTQYDASLDASVINEFTACVGRYGHSLIPSEMWERDPVTGEKVREILLRNNFFNPFEFKNGQFDRVAKGMTVDRQMTCDRFVTDDMRNYLYRRLYLNQTTGNDSPMFTIMRGREHGIPGYTYYRRYFFNDPIYNFDDLRKILPSNLVDLLESIYESVHDVDLYSAGLAEYPVKDGFLGRTFGVITAEQFKRSKFGDRYWFEHGDQAGSFTTDQLLEIKRSTLAGILCETSKIQNIQKEVFLPPSSDNPVVSCDEIHAFNFKLWKE